MTAATNVLELKDVGKSFGNTRAIDRATLNIRRGALHVILGENGAGKSTLLHIIAGLTTADAGLVSWSDDIAAGPRVGIVHQHSALVPALTAAENFALGTSTLGARFRPAVVGARMREIGASAGLTVDPTVVVASASIAERQRIEIVRAIADRPAVLLLDEPTAVLPPQESTALYAWMRSYVDSGGTVVVVTHRLAEAMRSADDITVMRRGVTVASGERSAFNESTLLSAILGEGTSSITPPAASHGTAHAVVASLHAIRHGRGAHGTRLSVDAFELRGGELVGVAGVDGAGQREFLRILAGRVRPDSGRVTLPSGDVGFIPEDRHAEGMVDEWDATENLALRGASRRRGQFTPQSLRQQALDLVARFDVRGAGGDAPLASLSGGNQQKFLVARELDPRPDVLVAENPTRGLDVRAAAFVRSQLLGAARDGAGVVVYSSDLDELLGISDRIVVCHGGHVLDSPFDVELIGRLMVSGRPA